MFGKERVARDTRVQNRQQRQRGRVKRATARMEVKKMRQRDKEMSIAALANCPRTNRDARRWPCKAVERRSTVDPEWGLVRELSAISGNLKTWSEGVEGESAKASMSLSSSLTINIPSTANHRPCWTAVLARSIVAAEETNLWNVNQSRPLFCPKIQF